MDNTKNFKENFNYNAKKVLQIIEKSKKENQAQTEIKQKKENINRAFSEVYDIINHLDEKLYNKIPQQFIEMIKENKDNTYHPHIDYNISINEQKLMKDTRIILSLIYREYIYSNENREE